MRSRSFALPVAVASALLGSLPTPLLAAAAPPAKFVPDPATVQRFGAGYRYPQDGWVVLHVEGAPYERGVQHGRLMAPELVGLMRCMAIMQANDSPMDAWKMIRTVTNTVFLRGFDREYLEEMKGIADGATAAGARFDDRAIDLVDIAAVNLWPELMTLDGANDATPTGLEGMVFPDSAPVPAKAPPEGHCSAFAATGKATRDGHPIIGHITMFDVYPSRWFNVWLDVQPEKGHRVLMQSYPGGIYSGMDYYLNDAGIAMVETTIDQTRLDSKGTPLASRVRKAMQYCDSIDGVVKILEEGNNGLYNNEWLLADMKTDEIAMLELATHASKLWRSGKNEWYDGTVGFYWGCNNTKDIGVRMETIAAANDRPANMVWHPADRDRKWVELYKANFGTMDEAFAKKAFTTPPLCSSASVDAKFTTGAMAKDLLSWGVFGPPLGKVWLPTPDEYRKYHEVRPLVGNSWTVLGPGVLNGSSGSSQPAPRAPVDLNDPTGEHVLAMLFEAPKDGKDDKDKDDLDPPTKPAWHGTILPASDGDIWLAAAFADYEKMVSLERGLAAAQSSKCLCSADMDKLAANLFSARSRYFGGVRSDGDVPLSRIKPSSAKDGWYRVASGKGVLVLAELRRMLGDAAFSAMMDSFGRTHAGKPASSAEFAAAASKASGKDLNRFFNYWLNETGLPRLTLVSATVDPAPGAASFVVRGKLECSGGPSPSNIEVTVEHADGETTQIVPIGADGTFEITAPKTPERVIVDKYARAARGNGSEADLNSWTNDVDHTLIVYGTQRDEGANHEAALEVQKAIRAGWHNLDLPVIADSKVSDADLKSNNLILIGRPETNAVTRKVEEALPISFAPASFSFRGQTYSNSDSTVCVAGVNPMNPRMSVSVLAGNSAAATYAHAADRPGRAARPEIIIIDPSGKPKQLVAPAPSLTKAFSGVTTAERAGH